MTSPLVRAWFAARIVDWANHAYAIGRGLLFGLGLTDREWDPIDEKFLDVPAPAMVAAGTLPGAVTAGLGSPSPALHLENLLPCPVCDASVGKDCITADKVVTGPHKARRDAAALQTAAES